MDRLELSKGVPEDGTHLDALTQWQERLRLYKSYQNEMYSGFPLGKSKYSGEAEEKRLSSIF